MGDNNNASSRPWQGEPECPKQKCKMPAWDPLTAAAGSYDMTLAKWHVELAAN